MTIEEEQKLVQFYCIKAVQLADFLEFPTNVKVQIPCCGQALHLLTADYLVPIIQASAVQILKRFYTANSPMTYHPKQIMPTAVYLATKTENHYLSLNKYSEQLPRTNPEDVIAPEYLVLQAMRYSLDIRHPHRGLEGAFMDLMAIANGKRGEIIKRDMGKLTKTKRYTKEAKTVNDLVQRIQLAHGPAKDTLKTAALLTDVYFLYTPSQIWMSAFLLADEPLTMFYLNSKIPDGTTMKEKLIKTLKACSHMLESSPSTEPGGDEMQELKKIDKKLHKCRNPTTLDLVGLNSAQKREGEANESDIKATKKQKLAQERKEDDIFGPAVG